MIWLPIRLPQCPRGYVNHATFHVYITTLFRFSRKSGAFSSLKKGDQFQLELKSGELLQLLRELAALYRLHRARGVPQGLCAGDGAGPALKELAAGTFALRA